MKKSIIDWCWCWCWCWFRARQVKRSIININGRRGLPLPPHILQVIFSKLPFSHLPTCRLVSKTWNHLVLEYASSSQFIPNAFLISTSEFVPNPKIHCIDLDTMTSVASFGFDSVWTFIIIINSCNGLLFISKCNRFDGYGCDGILNLMTNEFIEIPLPEVVEDIHCFGFGFSPTTKQYKLFRVAQINPDSNYIMEVYRFGRNGSNHNQWMHLHSLSFSIFNHGAYLNGVVYWIGKEKDKEYEYVIYALDVQTEKIEPIKILKVDPYTSPMYPFIQPYKDTIYVTISMTMPSCKIQLWILRMKDSWIREFVVDDVPYDWINQSLQLIKVFEDGVIWFQVRGDLFSLDKTRKMIKIKTLKSKPRTFDEVYHIESLNFGSLHDILAGYNFGSLPSILAD